MKGTRDESGTNSVNDNSHDVTPLDVQCEKLTEYEIASKYCNESLEPCPHDEGSFFSELFNTSTHLHCVSREMKSYTLSMFSSPFHLIRSVNYLLHNLT